MELQTDSMLLKNVISGIWKPPWIRGTLTEEIKELMQRVNVRVSHILGEGNKLADHIANYALDVGDMECHGFEGWMCRLRG